MSKIDDMVLFVAVVKAGGLAAAGRQLGLSPASMTARINAMESRYNVRLLNRTTRSLTLTDPGRHFYEACLRVSQEVSNAEAILQENDETLRGSLRISAPSDFGRRLVAPALTAFVSRHPEVSPYLYLSDDALNIYKRNFDAGICFGNLSDSNMVVKPLAANNYRVLCASPAYLEKWGTPKTPSDLLNHKCIVMKKDHKALNEWRFVCDGGESVIKIEPSFLTNDGALVRQWVLEGAGIAYKSIWDVRQDINEGRLEQLMAGQTLGFEESDEASVSLQLVYPSRLYRPKHLREFINFLTDYIENSSQ